jgi:DNA-binding transcriptional LysR family regulator
VAYETPSFEMVRGLVANSDAFSIMHSRPLSEWSLDGRKLVFPPIKEKLRPTRLGLARLKKLRPTKRAQAFAELCRKHFAATR